jgi:SAM-dependent methyltransferase
MSSFNDHFSARAGDYARFRPAYPAALVHYLGGLCTGRSLAWDAGTGSGQAAVALAGAFDHVVATDASAEQIRHATPHFAVTYARASEARSGLPAASADLCTAAQAAHWFDLPAYYGEVRRVLRPGGIVALWCYGAIACDHPEVDAALRWFYAERVGPWWPPERALVDAGYRTLPFPFDELASPAFEMHASLTAYALLGYVSTWSAVTACTRAEGASPLAELAARLEGRWPEGASLDMRWPLGLRVGRCGG